MDIKIENLPALHFLWLVPALLIVFAYGFWRKRQALQRFASTNLLAGLLPDVSSGRQKAKALLVLFAVGALVLALVDPRWGVHYEELHHRGIDTIFVLDVSRSMLARDVSPSRLERAKQYVRDAVEVLRGDRVGLLKK